MSKSGGPDLTKYMDKKLDSMIHYTVPIINPFKIFPSQAKCTAKGDGNAARLRSIHEYGIVDLVVSGYSLGQQCDDISQSIL
jgi:hypothetical protein